MRIILLATDEAPCLAPLTDNIPGPLVPVVNRPVIGIALELLARAGCKHALVSMYNRGGSIAAYLNTGRRWGMSIDYLTQREPLGSAGSLRWAGHLLNETFLVLPADAVLDLDIERALAYHRAHGGPATVIGHRRAPSVGAVSLQLDGEHVVSVGEEVAEASALYATGAYIFESSVLSYIPSQVASDCATQLIPSLIRAGQDVHAFELDGYWNPLQTFQEYDEAQRVFLLNTYHNAQPDMLESLDIPRLRYPSIEGRQIAPGIWVGLNDVIHPTAQLAPPVCIGDNCWIGREAEIGPAVVIGANVVIDDEATVEKAVVLDRTYVGRLLKLFHVVAHMSTLIDTRTSQSTHVADSFLLSEIGAEAPSGFFRRLFNICGAAAMLVLVLPVMVVLGILALLTTGRLFQYERRVGSIPPTLRNRQETGPHPFLLQRFSTERADGTTNSLGSWLLRSELAYLPGLLNVIRGHCELVGVKPLHPEEAARVVDSWQQKHYDRPAGLMGAWYAQATPQRDLDEILVIDAYYVATRTWHGDILLLLQCMSAWVRQRFRPRAQLHDPTLASDAR